MALTRPLRLKAEIAKNRPDNSTSSLPIAQVWVDSAVFHLDQSYDYRIPDNLSHLIEVGVRIQVPFHGREVEGLVVARTATSQSGSLKAVSKVISPHSVATAESINLIKAVATRWAAHPYDIIRSAIPPRVASVDKESLFRSTVPDRTRKKIKSSERRYIQIPPFVNRFDFISSIIKDAKREGSILLLAPDSRSASALHQLLNGSILLDSALDRSERYRNFLSVRNGLNLIVVGTRSAIFAPIEDLSAIVVVDEGSEHHYEQRAPGWNVRDVAILRSINSHCDLTCIGYSPSSEVARLIETQWMSYSSTKSRVNVSIFPPTHGELIPSRLVSEIRKAMKSGPILFISPRKGYSQAIICSKCRNMALCECGGKLVHKGSQSKIECVICARRVDQWQCRWCHGSTPYLLGRGSERFAFEIGATFPGTSIVQSTVENLVENFDSRTGFVIATPGAAPIASDGYAMVIVLEADRFFMQSDIRAHERSREILFSHAALIHQKGAVALVASQEQSMSGALSAWKPSLVSQKELRERQEVELPPFSRAITLDIDRAESQSLMRGLRKSQDEGRLPQSTRILGATQLKGETDRIILFTPLKDGEEVVKLLHEFQRRRSASKKSLASIRVDPYSLSR